MRFPTGKKTEPGQGPDPVPHAPARVIVPPGAVDTHAHVVGGNFIPERGLGSAAAVRQRCRSQPARGHGAGRESPAVRG